MPHSELVRKQRLEVSAPKVLTLLTPSPQATASKNQDQVQLKKVKERKDKKERKSEQHPNV
jgi:hypothetical protein